MAITRQGTGDLAIFSINSVSQIALISNVAFSLPVDTAEGRGVAYRGKNPQAVKQGGILRTTQMSNVDNCTRVANVDLTAFTLDGTNYLAFVRSLNFSGSFEHDENSGVGDYWKYPEVKIKDYAATVTLTLPDSTTANALRATMHDLFNATAATAIANRNAPLSFTLNGVTITVPMMITDAEWSGEDGRNQTVTFTLAGKDCMAGADYPTAPTGTTTILEKLFNAPYTPLAFALTPGLAANSTAFAGELVPASFSFSIEDGAVVTEQYEWLTHGPVTSTPAA